MTIDDAGVVNSVSDHTAARLAGAPSHPRHVLSVLDLTHDDLLGICARAIELKHAVAPSKTLRNRSVGIYFAKTSTRTRTAFTIGAARLGATVITYGPQDLQMNTGESLRDTARSLSGYLDALVMRTHENVEDMKVCAKHSRLAIVNALSATEHPTQACADVATLLDIFGRLDGLTILYCGEGNGTAASLALALSRVHSARLILATPVGYGLNKSTLSVVQSLAKVHGALIEETHEIDSLVGPFDVVYTSRWEEMGVMKGERGWRQSFMPFRVTRELVDRMSKPHTVFMHDLPAVRGEDVDSEVLDGERSVAWTQSDYKLFSAMSVLEWCLA